MATIPHLAAAFCVSPAVFAGALQDGETGNRWTALQLGQAGTHSQDVGADGASHGHAIESKIGLLCLLPRSALSFNLLRLADSSTTNPLSISTTRRTCMRCRRRSREWAICSATSMNW